MDKRAIGKGGKEMEERVKEKSRTKKFPFNPTLFRRKTKERL
jgi:hypothetical protein